MPTNVFAPAIPHNDSNYMVPSRISMWFRALCPNGSLGDPVELGSIGDISFTPNETAADLKSSRLGIMATSKRVITDVSGTLSFKMHEIAGSNVNLLFRPISSVSKTGASGITLYGQSRVRLSGSTATAFAPEAIEYDPATNTTSYPNISILRVESIGIVDPVTGRGTQYAVTADYTFTQVTGASSYAFAITTTASVVIPDSGATITMADAVHAYTATNGTTPVIGETVTTDAGATIRTLVGWIRLTAATGFVVIRGTGGTVDASDVLTGATSGATFTVAAAGTVATFVVTSYSSATTAALAGVGGTLAGALSASQLDTVCEQAFAAGLGGLAVTATGGYTGRMTQFNSANAGTPATLARVTTGAIPDGAEVVVVYSYLRDGTQYSILDGVQIEGQLQLQVLSINGPQSVYIFNRVNLNMEGAIEINPEARTEPTVQATILPDGVGNRGSFVLLDGFGAFSTVDCS